MIYLTQTSAHDVHFKFEYCDRNHATSLLVRKGTNMPNYNGEGLNVRNNEMNEKWTQGGVGWVSGNCFNRSINICKNLRSVYLVLNLPIKL